MEVSRLETKLEAINSVWQAVRCKVDSRDEQIRGQRKRDKKKTCMELSGCTVEVVVVHASGSCIHVMLWC
jgi:hypothetical protein